jgi:glycerol-3-phosphate dehydrogenase
MISIAGGKLTGYRKMAEKVVNRVAKKFKIQQNRDFEICKTDKISLVGGLFNGATEVKAYKETICQCIRDFRLSDYYIHYLVANYGKQTDIILNLLEPANQITERTLLQAELQFCLDNELVFKPLDFFNRRTGRLYFDIKSIEPALDVILKDFQDYFNWDENRVAEARMEVWEAIREVSTFGE